MGMNVGVALAGREVVELRDNEIARNRLLDPAGALPDDDQPFGERKPQRAVHSLRMRVFDRCALFRRAGHPKDGNGLRRGERQVDACPMAFSGAANQRLAGSRIDASAQVAE